MDGDLSWPAGLYPYKVAFYLRPHTSRATSPLTNTSKVYGLSAPLWAARLTFRAGYDPVSIDHGYGTVLDRGFAASLDVLIQQMQGGVNRLAFHDFRRPAPVRPQAVKTILTTTGAAAGDTQMTVAGFWPGSPAFGVGEYIGGDGRAHRALTTTFADATGIAVVAFDPPLVTALAAGAAVSAREVTSWFRLTSDDAGANESEVGQPAEIVLEFVEDAWW